MDEKEYKALKRMENKAKTIGFVLGLLLGITCGILIWGDVNE